MTARRRLPLLLILLAAFIGLGIVRWRSGDLRFVRNLTGPAVAAPLALDSPRYLLYEPPRLDRSRRHTLVVALSPGADAAGMIGVWRSTADRRQWIVFASKTMRNGVPYDDFVPQLVADIREVAQQETVAPSRIVAAGISGGAMASYCLAQTAPDLIKAVVANTGMMPEYDVPGGVTRRPPPAELAAFPRGKPAVLLASPTDFRYREMQEDRALLESLGWKIHWIEFAGGHTFAPQDAYDAAADWLAAELGEAMPAAGAP